MNNFCLQLIEQLGSGVLIFDRGFRIVGANRFMRQHTAGAVLEGDNLFQVYPELSREQLLPLCDVALSGDTVQFRWQEQQSLFDFTSTDPRSGDTHGMYQECTLFAIRTDDGEPLLCLTVHDETSTALDQHRLQEAQQQLIQSEKLASIGQLAAGVAHEINNPVCYIKSNLGSLRDYLKEMDTLIDGYAGLLERLGPVQAVAERDELYDSLDMAFIRSELPEMMNETFEGVERIEGIVGSLKDFARVDNQEWQLADLHQCLESTLKVVNHEVKYVVREVVRDYGDLPPVYCLPAQLSQVFMNLILNAAQSIPRLGTIGVKTEYLPEQERVRISISDDGCGIPEEQQGRIFDPFFTTKPVGKGTGLGLSVSYGIVQAHGGKISVESTPGKGSTFTLLLPVKQPEAPAD